MELGRKTGQGRILHSSLTALSGFVKLTNNMKNNKTLAPSINEQTSKAGIGFEMKQMLKLLGSSMYKGNEADVAMKELLQNSFDAVKTVLNPTIDIFVANNTITIQDNGIGMSRDTVENVYLKIGGTLKDHLEVGDRSGGLGLAKVQFFMTAEHINVQTVKDGVMTILDSTQEDLLSGNADLSFKTTNLPNGTIVALKFPREIEMINGSKKLISCSTYCRNYKILKQPLLLDNLTVNFNGTPLEMSIPEKNSLKLQFSTDWGDIDIYVNPDINTQDSYNQVLSAGLFQFAGYNYDYQLETYINIKPKVKAGDPGYPFNNTREDFNVSVSEDIKAMNKYLIDIQSMLKSEEVKRRFSNLIDLEYTDINLSEEERAAIKERNIVKLRDDSIQFESSILMDIMENFGHLKINKENKYVQKSIVLETTSVAAYKVENNSTLKFHNNTTGNYNIPGSKEFFDDYASLIKKLIAEPEIKGLNRLKAMQDEAFVVGISIDKEYSGCYLTGTTCGLFLNPFSNDVQCEGTFVGHFMHTVIHEMAHAYEECHDTDFCRMMGDIYLALYKSGAYNLYEKYIQVILNRHRNTVMELIEIFNNSSAGNSSLNMN